MIKLIGDGGSTKSNWTGLNEDKTKFNFNTEGYNPYFVGVKGIVASLDEQLPDTLNRNDVGAIFYYGAGCSTPDKVEIVKAAMAEIFPMASIYIGHDLLAAARALLGINRGFAAILGTGTNTCIYDGKDIELNIDSLGYFLGDEGSGSFIGKKLLKDHMRGYLPLDLSENFNEAFQLTNEDIFDRLYNKPLPNRFLASFSKFVYDNYNFSYCREVVKEGFEAFFKNLVSKYPYYTNYKFNCIGSVGYNFRDELKNTSERYGMECGKIIRSPIDDLVFYHENYL